MAAQRRMTIYSRIQVLRAAIRSVLAWWSARRALRRQRRDLGCLDEHLLRDIGVTRQQARCEVGKSFWF